MFWTVLKADLLFAVCSITFSLLATLAIARWRRRKMKAAAVAESPKSRSPYGIIFGGKELNPGHCPLCGQGWPLPGPIPDEPKPKAE